MFQRLKPLLIKILTRIRNPLVEDEHFVPGLGMELAPYIQRGSTTAVHHLIRYQWAVRVLSIRTSGRLLDIACGDGYGSHMIARNFPEMTVLGADYDRNAVQRAREKYVLPNLSFRLGDVLHWEETIGSDRLDWIVSFDTLEHIAHREIMMENLVRHLDADGTMLLSTPCGHEKNVLKPRWPSHRIEYSAESLYDFLSRYFHEIQRPEDEGFPGIEVFDQLADGPIDYLLKMNPVICRRPVHVVNPYR